MNKKCVYLYEFPDKSIYVGVTQNEEIRKKQHKSDRSSAVYKHCNKTGLEPTYKLLEPFVDSIEAFKLEQKWISTYRLSGLNVLNSVSSPKKFKKKINVISGLNKHNSLSNSKNNNNNKVEKYTPPPEHPYRTYMKNQNKWYMKSDNRW